MRAFIKRIIPFLSLSMLSVSSALAAGPAGGFGLEETAAAAKLIQSKTNPPDFGIATIAGTVVGYLLAFVGVIFFVLMLYGGFLWMTSRGNEEQVKKAVGILRSAVIGIIIVFASYIITRLVVTQLKGAVGL